MGVLLFLFAVLRKTTRLKKGRENAYTCSGRTGGAVCFSGKAERFGIFDALEQQILERKNRKIVTICC